MISRFLGVLLIAGTLAACQKQTKLVYVLEEPQSVTLTASASAQSVRMGEAVVLHAQRTTSGKWKQVPLESVTRGQCWVYQPPVESGLEVADAIEWDVYPDGAVLFRAEYRMDHTRVVIVDMQGTIKLTPRSTVKCEPDRVVEGVPIQIEVS